MTKHFLCENGESHKIESWNTEDVGYSNTCRRCLKSLRTIAIEIWNEAIEEAGVQVSYLNVTKTHDTEWHVGVSECEDVLNSLIITPSTP